MFWYVPNFYSMVDLSVIYAAAHLFAFWRCLFCSINFLFLSLTVVNEMFDHLIICLAVAQLLKETKYLHWQYNRTDECFNYLYSAALSEGNRIHEVRSVEKPSLEFKGSLLLIYYG